MTTADHFSELRDAFWRNYRKGSYVAALGIAEQSWTAHPERRGYTWLLRAAALCSLQHADEAMAVLWQAEMHNHLWRSGLLNLPELDRLRGRPDFQALLDRVRERVAGCDFQPQLLLTEPDPGIANPCLLFGFHGAGSTVSDYHTHWLPAAHIGCLIASAQSSQPATETTFCWDDPNQVRRDVQQLATKLPAHGEIVLTGFSQGAAVALRLALAGDLLPARGVIAVAPGYPPNTEFPQGRQPLAVTIVRGEADSYGRTVPTTVKALEEAGTECASMS